jgi:hypothetical protein
MNALRRRLASGGAFIGRNAGEGPDFFSMSLRLSRAFTIRRDVRVEGLVEAFDLTNRVNVLTVNANFGSGAYPTNPLSTFGQMTAVGEPRSVQLGIRLRF